MDEKEYEELKIEVIKLEQEDLVNMQKTLNHYISEGDLRENAGYDSTMEEITLLTNRIFKMKNIIENVRIIKSVTGNLISIGDKLLIRDTKSSWSGVFKLTGTSPISGNPDNGEISITSPIGKKIYGKLSGVFTILVDTEVIEYEIKKI